MLDDIRYIIGAVARKDFVPEFTHMKVEDNFAYATDGLLSMGTPIDLGMNVLPRARDFMQAIQACDDDEAIATYMTPTGRLAVKCGKFRAYVNCLDEEDNTATFPMPEGDEIEVTDELMDAITAVAPFMGIDASRPWSRGVRFYGQSAFATNNIILLERWHGTNFPHEVIVPADCIKELLRIKQRPTKIQLHSRSITFWFGERWMRSQLAEGAFPEQVNGILEIESNPQPVAEGFFEALGTLQKFLEESSKCWILPDRIATVDAEDVGAMVEIETGVERVIVNAKILATLQDTLTSIDFSLYPKPMPFFGEKLRGVLIGMT